jgi:uncharacterized protein YprB with RNaseH-like and TPR domain
MPIPIAQLSKQKIIEIANWKCPHKHNGIEHYTCWLKYGELQERTCILDLETSNLDAPFGLLLCWGIKEYGTDVIKQGSITKQWTKDLDRSLVRDCIDELNKYAVVITYNGTFFDLRWLRAKALHYNLDFPPYGALRHIDLYFIVRNRLKIGRNSLENACNYLGIQGKTRIEWEHWLLAVSQADKKSIEDILDHNKKDLIITEKLFDVLKPYAKIIRRSV